MRWTFTSGNPDADDDLDDNAYMDSIVIDDVRGEDVGLGYLDDIAVWYADNNVRHGYHVAIEGSAFKGPYVLEWDRIVVHFEECGAVAALREHLHAAWGPEGVALGQIGAPRLTRLS